MKTNIVLLDDINSNVISLGKSIDQLLEQTRDQIISQQYFNNLSNIYQDCRNKIDEINYLLNRLRYEYGSWSSFIFRSGHRVELMQCIEVLESEVKHFVRLCEK
jgi:site-specific recombinase